jgi:putative transposase
MQSIGRRYVRYVNNDYGRSGTLWEGRFKSSLIDSERYLMTCYQYIEENPLRAGMVQMLNDYRWSSYHHNALGMADKLITQHPLYNALAQVEEIWRAICKNSLMTGCLRKWRKNLMMVWKKIMFWVMKISMCALSS